MRHYIHILLTKILQLKETKEEQLKQLGYFDDGVNCGKNDINRIIPTVMLIKSY